MFKASVASALIVLLLFPSSALEARRSGSSSHRSYAHSSSRSHSRSYSTTRSHSYHSRFSTVTARDSHGRIKRSESARRDFMRRTGYPHGRKGYVIDHVKPLACGGADNPSNMQWQTRAEARAKDKWERKGCKLSGRSSRPFQVYGGIHIARG